MSFVFPCIGIQILRVFVTLGDPADGHDLLIFRSVENLHTTADSGLEGNSVDRAAY